MKIEMYINKFYSQEANKLKWSRLLKLYQYQEVVVEDMEVVVEDMEVVVEDMEVLQDGHQAEVVEDMEVIENKNFTKEQIL